VQSSREDRKQTDIADIIESPVYIRCRIPV